MCLSCADKVQVTCTNLIAVIHDHSSDLKDITNYMNNNSLFSLIQI